MKHSVVVFVYIYTIERTTIVFIHLVPKARVSMKNNNKPIPCGLGKRRIIEKKKNKK